MNDFELLQRYVREESQDAFAQIVSQNVDLVYSVAFRLVGDAHLAQDVTQQTFALLSRKAARLGGGTIVSAWLYRAARNLALETLKRENRRFRGEQLALEAMNSNDANSIWAQIEPFLDEAMRTLGSGDHDAIVLRFFERRSLKEVGEAMGTGEDAAQKRVSRALEKLRLILKRRGITVSTGMLGAAVIAGAVQSAPAGMAASALSISLIQATGKGLGSYFYFMATTHLKTAVISGMTAALLISSFVLHQQNARLKAELMALRASALKNVAPLASDTKFSQAASEELVRLRKEHQELVVLRNRVTQLSNELRRKGGGEGLNNASIPSTEKNEADTPLFSLALTNRVDSGNTLVAGGWKNQGLRGYFMTTPVVDSGTGSPQLEMKGQMVWAPESLWKELGWADSISPTRRSTLVGELTPEQVQALVQAVKSSPDGGFSSESKVKLGEDGHFGFGYSMDDPNDPDSAGMMMGVDGNAKINADGKSVELEFHPSAVDSKVQIHSALK